MRRKLEEKYDITKEYDFGWLDINPIRYGHLLNQLSSVYMTELDVLDELDEIKMCTKYNIGEEEYKGILPTLIDDFGKLTPVYKTMKGWKSDTTEVDEFHKLPVNCQSFIKEVEKNIGVQINFVSTNNDENEVIRIVR